MRAALACVFLCAGTICGELATGLVAQVVAPALLLLGIVAGIAHLSFTSNAREGVADSTKRVASSR